MALVSFAKMQRCCGGLGGVEGGYDHGHVQRLHAGGDELFGVGDAGAVDGLLRGGAGGLVALGEFGFKPLVLGL